MKTMRLIQCGLAALLLAATGCASMSGERTGRALAQSAVYFGTVKHLRAHPEDRPIFEATKANLESLVVQTNWSAAALAAAFQQLPINGLEGPDGDLYVSTFLVLWDGAVQDSVSVETPEQVREIVAPLLIGLRLGLDAAALPNPQRAERPSDRGSPACEYLRYGGFNYRGNWATRYAYRTY
jgi:hypothetical protein